VFVFNVPELTSIYLAAVHILNQKVTTLLWHKAAMSGAADYNCVFL